MFEICVEDPSGVLNKPLVYEEVARVCSRLKLGVSGVLIDYEHIQFRGLSLWQHILQVYQAFFLNYSVSADLKTGIILPLFKGKGKGAKANNKDNASVNSKHQHPPRLTPGNFFKVVKFPDPGQNILQNYGPGAKNRQKPRPWEQFCGPSRQFCHDCETIHIFLVLFFSLAFFEFFQRL